jgi:alpha-glucoside transport system permease protein
MDRLITTIVTVVVAISIIGSIWVVLNLLADQAKTDWARFLGLSGALLAGGGFALLRGNLSIKALLVDEDLVYLGGGGGFFGRIEWSVVGALIWGLGMFAIGSLQSRGLRLVVGTAIGALTGFLLSENLQVWHRPNYEPAAVILWIVVGAVAVAGLSAILQRGRFDEPSQLVPPLLTGAFLGAVVGFWLAAPWHTTLGSTPENDVLVAAIVPLVLLGLRIGWNGTPTPGQISLLDNRLRAALFLGPAVIFLSAALVIPAIRTIILSFYNRDSSEFVGFDNYQELWSDSDSFDFSNWRSLFTSDLYTLGLFLVGAGLLIALVAHSRRNRVNLLDGGTKSVALLGLAVLLFVGSAWSIIVSSESASQFTSVYWLVPVAVLALLLGVSTLSIVGKIPQLDVLERTGASSAALLAGLFLFAYAVLSVVRGTFFNNIWWVITVTILSVSLGLTIAVLAEKADRSETVAKSLIFMPMAVSFVGASIVWRLQYQPRLPATEPQTGVINAVWVQIGELSHAGWPRVLALLVLAGLLIVLGMGAWRKHQVSKSIAAPAAGILVFGYLFYQLARRSLGGFVLDANGDYGGPDVIRFLNEAPFNNVFMMIILIWIQTGFAMVILSAAIKGVPSEFLEAARVDGATDSQTFFQITFPQILPTVGVVTTTLIVLVTKVFDIVAVTTGGNFGTNVLANDMFEVSFSFFNTGLGAAISVFILLSVAPVMFLNVRRMQSERRLNR